MSQHYGKPLTVEVKDGQLVIAISVQTLAHAVSYADWANPYDEARGDYFRTFAIVDPEGFAKDVARALLNEREDGLSKLSDVLDKASEAALDDGSEHCEYDRLIRNGENAPEETWAIAKASR